MRRPVLWSRAWRGHLWHARRYAWDITGEKVNVAAECGYRPGDGQRPGRVSTWSPARCQWVETTEREPHPLTRASNGQWLHDMRCSGCLGRLGR